MNLELALSENIQNAIATIYGTTVELSLIQLQKTKKEFQGDLTFVTFPIVKLSKKSPQITGLELGEYLQNNSPLVDRFQIVSGFLNLTIKQSLWIQLLCEIDNKEDFGYQSADPDNTPVVMVEYSSPNTNKPLHLGHVRNNLLGYSLCKILAANGNKVIKTNIVNDRGIHICKSMLAWQKWGNNITPISSGKKGDHLIGDFYVLFDKYYKAEIAAMIEMGKTKEEAEAASVLMEEAREMLRKWESADPATVSLWKEMNSWVYAGFDETYQRLGVDFDKIYYESETYLEGKNKVTEGLSKGIFYQKGDGSIWADLTEEGLDHKLLLRSDGTSVYMTQDIGTAKLRYDDYPIDKMVYVVGNEQNYHFQVLSILLDKLGFEFGKELVHFSYGMVELPEGKMKSREGTVVDADDLMDEMIGTSRETSKELGKLDQCSAEEAEDIVRKIGLGALKYFILKVDPKKNMVFNPKESIDFNGNTGPFIQYTYTRIQSILRKFAAEGGPFSFDANQTLALSEKESALIQNIATFPSIVQEAGVEYSPAVIANYCYDLAKEFNQFYHDHSILNVEDPQLKIFRVILSKNVGKVLDNAMQLLGIELPERM